MWLKGECCLNRYDNRDENLQGNHDLSDFILRAAWSDIYVHINQLWTPVTRIIHTNNDACTFDISHMIQNSHLHVGPMPLNNCTITGVGKNRNDVPEPQVGGMFWIYVLPVNPETPPTRS